MRQLALVVPDEQAALHVGSMRRLKADVLISGLNVRFSSTFAAISCVSDSFADLALTLRRGRDLERRCAGCLWRMYSLGRVTCTPRWCALLRFRLRRLRCIAPLVSVGGVEEVICRVSMGVQYARITGGSNRYQ